MSPVPSQNFGGGGLDDPGTQTESSIERRFHPPEPVPGPAPGSVPGSNNAEWGRSDSLDPDNVGDIADEGVGHRG
jgi:hypothetical protein